MRWKQNKWKVIVPVLILAVLAGAFWYGGSAPGLHGWEVETGSSQPPVMENPAVPTPVEETPVTETPPAAPAFPPEESVNTVPDPTPETDLERLPGVEAGNTDYSQQGMTIDPNTGKDKYLTDPVPEGKPIPVEPQDVTISDVAHTCTISISCATILNNMDWLAPEKVELVPEDGWILQPTQVTFYEGESVFNMLQRTCKQQGIHMEFENTPMYNSAYIEGIHNLYEFDCGELSGWMYKVNEWFPNYGCSRYQLHEGDVICWIYTCDLGIDVGGYYSTGG